MNDGERGKGIPMERYVLDICGASNELNQASESEVKYGVGLTTMPIIVEAT
jgi:hypothetical protein